MSVAAWLGQYVLKTATQKALDALFKEQLADRLDQVVDKRPGPAAESHPLMQQLSGQAAAI